jgi:hypothetical protein
MDEGVRILHYHYLKYLKGSLTCRKILRHGTSGFTSHPKEGMLLISVVIKNPPPWPGLNPRPLGLVASTLTTTPPSSTSLPAVWLNIRPTTSMMLLLKRWRVFISTVKVARLTLRTRLHYEIVLFKAIFLQKLIRLLFHSEKWFKMVYQINTRAEVTAADTLWAIQQKLYPSDLNPHARVDILKAVQKVTANRQFDMHA